MDICHRVNTFISFIPKGVIPRRKSNSQADSDDSESGIFTKDIMTESIYSPIKADPANYTRGHNRSDHSDYKISNYLRNENDGTFEIGNKTSSTEDVSAKERQNLAINPGAEIYNMDQLKEYRFSGLGRFMFKPRFKYFNDVIDNEHDVGTEETLCVMKKCEHYSKTNSEPGDVIVYKDLKTF